VASSHISMDWPDAQSTPEASHIMLAQMAADSSIHDELMDPMTQNHIQGHSQDSGKKGHRNDGADSPPAWAEMKTKAGKDRKRLPLACIACRRKKIRCSGSKPACKHCLRSRVPCVYKVNTRKATPRTDYMAMLDKRLKRMEERVIKLIPKDAEVASIPRAVLKPTAPSSSSKSPKRSKKRSVEDAFGAQHDLEEWSKVQPNGVNDPRPPKITHSQGVDESSLLIEGAEYLPPKAIQLHLAEIYFEYVYGQSYPLLHKPTFMRNLVAGTIPPVLVLAICAISARFSHHPQLRSEPAFLRGEEWAGTARDISMKYYDSPNITILTVYLLLGLHEFGTCHGGRSWMFGGMAQRMALMMQLHKDGNGPQQESKPNIEQDGDAKLCYTNREIRRRVMWSCFLMDRFTSSGSDRPICFAEECITVPLPIKESLFLMEIEGETETLDGTSVASLNPTREFRSPRPTTETEKNIGTPAYLIRLVAIWGRLVNYFNLGGRQREDVPMWHSSSKFQALAQSLKKFNFPEEMSWNQDNLETHRADKSDNQFVFMHIVYQHLRLFLHRFAIPGYGSPLPRDIPQTFLAESQRIALDAANEVSALVEEALVSNVTAPFAGYAAFYSSTVHIQGVFAKNVQMSERSKKNLGTNIKFLAQMKRWWGMFHFVAQDLKELYRTHSDAIKSRPINGSQLEDGKRHSSIFQYGDWFDKYPSGVSNTEYDDPSKGSQETDGTNAGVLGSRENDPISVDEFFSKLESGEFTMETDASGRQKLVKRVKHANGYPEDRPKLSMNTNMLDFTRDTSGIQLTGTVSMQRPNLYFTSTNVNIPIDGFAAATPFLSTANAMAMRPPQQPLPQSPSTSTPTDLWNFSFIPESSRSVSGDPYPYHMNSGMSHGGDWYMPWNIEPPPGLTALPMDRMSPSVAGSEGLAMDFDAWGTFVGSGAKRPAT
jgi:Fungal specific transcription factor domain/Fungal Zn(2)-Cys(6) binuclear cluster domain